MFKKVQKVEVIKVIPGTSDAINKIEEFFENKPRRKLNKIKNRNNTLKNK
jgi:hypothetical protein